MRKILTGLSLFLLAGCAAPQRAPTTSVVPIPPTAPAREPDVFTGAQATQLRALVGQPAFTRKDGATDMWRYDNPACHAFFFFTGTPLRVSHVETVPQGKDRAADPACLNALRAKRS